MRFTIEEFGLNPPASWLATVGFSIGWLVFISAHTSLADKIATRWFAKPPTLTAFRVLQQSRMKLVIGIVVAWILGGFLEELILRGIIPRLIEHRLSVWLVMRAATGIAISTAALGAGIVHLYQGLRAAIIITQLSVLFGLLFVVSGHNLWSVMLCHGLYDTIAFIRFAYKQSRYSTLDADV